MSNRTIQWAGVAGMLFVVLILITVFGASQPPMEAQGRARSSAT